MHPYLVYDVFTKDPFGGNPLAILTRAQDIKEQYLQRIAREFNFSETVFLYPPEHKDHTARMRIFTPTMEIPFAGHPTIGTAVALNHLGHGPDMVLEMGVGPLVAYAQDGAARFTTQVPLQTLCRPDTQIVARSIGLPVSAIETKNHSPTMASVGLPFTITELKSRDDLRKCQTDIAGFRHGAEQYPDDSTDFAQFVYVRDAKDASIIHARMFAPLDNIPEDPATGSASAALAALLFLLHKTDQNFTILQGEDMCRLSVIHLTADASGVEVAGHARKIMDGHFIV